MQNSACVYVPMCIFTIAIISFADETMIPPPKKKFKNIALDGEWLIY